MANDPLDCHLSSQTVELSPIKEQAKETSEKRHWWLILKAAKKASELASRILSICRKS